MRYAIAGIVLGLALSFKATQALATPPPECPSVTFHFELIDAQDLWAQFHEASWFRLGVAYLEAEQYLEAINAFSCVVELNPHLTEAYQNLGYAYFRSGDFQQSALCLATAIHLDPQCAHAHHLLGIIFTLYSMYESAIVELEQAAAGNPENALIQFDLGYAQEFNGSLALAKNSYEKAVKIDPQFKEALSRLRGIEEKLKEASAP